MNLIPNVLGFIVSLSLISSCTTTKEVITKPDTTIALQEPDPLVLREVNWVIISKETASSIIAKEEVIFGLNTESYENLAKNTNDIRTYLSQQKSIINAYKRYIND